MTTVTVFFLQLNTLKSNKEKYISALGESQLKKAESYKNSDDYLLSVGGAYLVNKYTPNSPISIGEFGKPYKDGSYFNLSHSGEIVALAVSDKEVGLDVEGRRIIKESVLKRVLSEKEKEHITSTEDFLKIWTLKESLLKCTGRGLISRLNCVPSIPEGLKEYEGEKYFSKSFEYSEHIISVTVKTDEEFEIKIVTV